MDVFSILSYINKVSLFAFFITTLVVGYQIYVLKKEKVKNEVPSIPDFKEKNNLNEVTNFTKLPNSLLKKETKAVNYSKLVFLIITLLTLIIIIFVISVIKKNSSTSNQTLNNPPPVTPTKVPVAIKPKDELNTNSEPSPTAIITPTVIIPTNAAPTVKSELATPTAEPTEIVLAQGPSVTPEVIPTTSTIDNAVPQVLPETGSVGKGLLILGVAISTIFFSFWF